MNLERNKEKEERKLMNLERNKEKEERKQMENERKKDRKKKEQRRVGCTLVCHSTLGRL